jgi:hypothetical protein
MPGKHNAGGCGCCDDCPLPVVTCSYDDMSGEVTYSVTGADTANLEETCYVSGVPGTPTLSSISLTGGAGGSSFTPSSNCVYRVIAINECGTTTKTCGGCLCGGIPTIGLLVEVSGVPDTFSCVIDHYDNTGALYGTVTYSWSGFSAWNHSRYYPYDVSSCNFIQLARVSLGLMKTHISWACVNSGSGVTWEEDRSLDIQMYINGTGSYCGAVAMELDFGDGATTINLISGSSPSTSPCTVLPGRTKVNPGEQCTSEMDDGLTVPQGFAHCFNSCGWNGAKRIADGTLYFANEFPALTTLVSGMHGTITATPVYA